MAKAEDLYIMRNTLLPGIYKVGRSSDVQKRALSLQASQPFRVVIVAVFPGGAFLEKAIHLALKQYRIKGGAGIGATGLSNSSTAADAPLDRK